MHKVKCYFCGEIFDRDKFPFEKVSERRYAHADCFKEGIQKKRQEENDKIELEQYIMRLLDTTTISAKVRQQINKYQKENHYTYQGMLKTLKYFYDIKGNDKSKANGGIGIIPFVYNEAYNYYYAIYQANQKNIQKEEITSKQRVLKIPVPTVAKKENRFFTFLMEGDTNGK